MRHVATRVLSRRLVDAFQGHIRQGRGLRVASAWMSRGTALKALVSRPRRFKLQAIIGIYGTSTDPRALGALIDRFGDASLRIADPPNLFHPKLFLFDQTDRTVAWIGSANFTRGGLVRNSELMLEIDQRRAVSEMETWFDARWSELDGQDVRAALTDYEKEWEAASKKRQGTGGLGDIVEGLLTMPDGELRIHPKRKIGKGYPGVFEYGDGETEEYETLADGLRTLLRRLSEGRDDFFKRCVHEHAFKPGEKPYVAKARTVEQARRKIFHRPTITVTPLLLAEGGRAYWWLTEQTTTPQKWHMAKAAIKVFNEMPGEKRRVELVDESRDSWPVFEAQRRPR